MNGPTSRDASGAWDGHAYATASGHHRALDDWFLDRLTPAGGDVVVDLGCGSGEFTAHLAELVDDGRVIGVEPDPSMLAAAGRHQHPNLEFVAASAERVDEVVAPASADLVLSRAMLHWLPISTYPTVFAAVMRILRPGGWFHCESAAAGNVAKITAVLDDVAARFELPGPPPFPDAGTVYALLEQAGFPLGLDSVRTVVQRRPFTQERIAKLLETQASVVLTRDAPDDLAPAIVAAAINNVDQTRRWDGTFDQTFVRLEILTQRPHESDPDS